MKTSRQYRVRIFDAHMREFLKVNFGTMKQAQDFASRTVQGHTRTCIVERNEPTYRHVATYRDGFCGKIIRNGYLV